MTPQAALIELLERVGAMNGLAVLVSDYELSQWPDEAVAAMKSQKLIVKVRASASAICPGCERECIRQVHTLPVTTGNAESFIVCEDRSDINRVVVPANRLTQWQCNADTVCGFIANSFGLRRSAMRLAGAGLWDIGIVKGNKRAQMLCLQADGILTLVVGSSTVPLADLIEYHNGVCTLDVALIRQLVDSATTTDVRYTPTNAKREMRKLDTQAMYESWQKAYRDLKKSRPNMSDVWYSKQIEKMSIAKGRNAGTIKKHMQS